MTNPLTIAAGLSLFFLAVGAIAASRGQWVVARVFAKGTVAMALSIVPLGLGSTGAQAILMEEGTTARSETIGEGMAQLQTAAYFALPALLIAVTMWVAARGRLAPRRPLD